jgi:hypothetical protein
MQERIVYSKENRIVIRNDLMISNWALILYILYMLQIVKISPLPILLYATFVATTCVLIGIYYQNISANNFLAYIIMTFFLKIIPIYTIRNDKITKNVLLFSLSILVVYLLYLDINNTSFLSVYRALTNNNPTQLGIYYMNAVNALKKIVSL